MIARTSNGDYRAYYPCHRITLLVAYSVGYRQT